MVESRETRGKTTRGRLRLLDAFLTRSERDLLARTGSDWDDAAFVDVGFGEYPWTTTEAAEALREVNPSLEVIGVDNDASRVENARRLDARHVRFIEAGFDLADALDHPARLIRAMNVLRQYPPDQVDDAHARWAEALVDGGLLVEGTSDKHGHILSAYLLRRRGERLEREALLFATDFERGFAPLMMRDFLPRDIRREAHEGTPIRDFLDAWTRAWQTARDEGVREPPRAFEASVLRLTEAREDAHADAWMAEQGYLLWKFG